MSPKMVVGGQAVIEGVMMRSPNAMAVAVRTPDGSIAVREDPWNSLFKRLPFLRLPFLRGGVVLLEAMQNGMSALRWSAEQAATEPPATEVAASAADNGTPKAAAKPASAPPGKLAITGTIAFSLLLAFGLFVGLPHGIGLLLGNVFGIPWMNGQHPAFHIVAGLIKVSVFLGYITLIGRMPEIKRVFQYHGAEHKSIYVWENDEPLTVENARKYTRLHPRCGTSFIFIVILASILVFTIAFSFIPPLVPGSTFLNQILIVAIKLPLLFPIAGLAYEFQRYSANNIEKAWVRPFIWPGLMLQKITTQEPDDSQLEVALAALKKALLREKAGFAADEVAQPMLCTVYRSYVEIDAPPVHT